MLLEEYKIWLKENLPSVESEDNPIDSFVKNAFKNKKRENFRRRLIKRPHLPDDPRKAIDIISKQAEKIGLR